MTNELTSSLGHQVHWLVDPCKISEAPEYEQVVRHLLIEMRTLYPDLPREDGRYLSRLIDHMRVIVCNLHSAFSSVPSMFIAFQRAGGAYKADSAYRGFQFTFSNVRRITDFLHTNGYIEWKRGYPGSKDYAPQLYKMRPTSKSLDLLDRFHADPATIYRKTTHLETVIMKGRKKRPPKKTWKGVGNTLMNHDSQMAEEVLLHFARKGVACLPVHDSFIIDIRYAGECWDVMQKAYAWRFGQQIPVDIIDGLEQAKKILAGPKVIETSPTSKEMALELIRMLHE